MAISPEVSKRRIYAKTRVDGDCLVWTGYRDKGGYGQFGSRRHYGTTRVHRRIWEIEVGPIPEGLFVCHHCDNPPCIKISHLFLGTPSANTVDMVRKGRGLVGASRRHAAKLSLDQVSEIARRKRGGEETRSLATEFGVSISHVNTIARPNYPGMVKWVQ